MTLVRSRQLPLSGNRWCLLLLLSVFASSCAVLKPTPPVETEPQTKEDPVPAETTKKEVEKVVESRVNSIIVLLPFQLDRISGQASRSDIKRVEIPLDFYQGLEIALSDLSKQGNNFKVTVLDSKDSEAENARLALLPEVQSADLIIGPIFPKEIPVFAKAGKLSYSLQVSPLAASKPSQFNIPNLVSLVAPIDLHSEGLANYLTDIRKKDDVIVLINSQEESSYSFLSPLKKYLTENKMQFIEIFEVGQLVEKLTLKGSNFIISGATPKYAVNSLLNSLVNIKVETGASVQLFGHPTWLKNSYDNVNLQILRTKVTTSFYVDPHRSEVSEFQRKYKAKFDVDPSEYAYKGFDTGYFFGSLLIKYGAEYQDHLNSEEYTGLQTSYKFEKFDRWGFVNTYIRILEFDGYQYKHIN